MFGIFKGKSRLDKLMEKDKQLAKEVYSNPKDYMMVTIETQTIVARYIKATEDKPIDKNEIREIGKEVNEAYKKEVTEKFDELLADFCEKWGMIPQLTYHSADMQSVNEYSNRQQLLSLLKEGVVIPYNM
jgi:hypothetical protein